MISRLLFDDAIQCFATMDSTNSYAIELVKSENIREGTIIWAIEQTAGRGQQATKWQSAVNMSLTFSQILFPSFLELPKIAYLGMCVALAVQEVLSDISEKKISIKWPNDIYVGNKKMGGILIENGIKGNHISYAVVGIGININQTEFSADIPNAISLYQLTNQTHDLASILSAIQQSIARFYELLEAEKYNTIKMLYLHELIGFHQEVEIESELYAGKVRVVDIQNDGRIVLETQDSNILSFGIKELVWKL